MLTSGELDLGGVLCRVLIVPLIDQQNKVTGLSSHPQTHTVAGKGVETVTATFGEVGRAHPAHREIVSRESRIRGTITPVEVNSVVATHHVAAW